MLTGNRISKQCIVRSMMSSGRDFSNAKVGNKARMRVANKSHHMKFPLLITSPSSTITISSSSSSPSSSSSHHRHYPDEPAYILKHNLHPEIPKSYSHLPGGRPVSAERGRIHRLRRHRCTLGSFRVQGLGFVVVVLKSIYL